MTTPDPLRAALAEMEELYISLATPPITHDWCRLCRSSNEVASQPIDHWRTCPIGIVTTALATDTAPLDARLAECLDDAIHALAGGDLAGGLLAVRVARERLAFLR